MLHKSSNICANKEYEFEKGPLGPIGKYWLPQNLIMKLV